MSSFISRYRIPLSIAVCITSVLVAVRLNPVGSETYCYQSVLTSATAAPSISCFTVSDGIITRVSAREQNAFSIFSSRPAMRAGHVIPGLIDGHGHLLQYGEFLQSVDLFGSQTIDEALKRTEDYLEKHPDVGTKDNWIRGTGWNQNVYGRMPTAVDLDTREALKDRYVMLDRVDVHCIWVSFAVLALLPSPIPDVPGGEVVRHPGLGVFCDNAMDLVTKYLPRPGKNKKKEFVRTAMEKLNEVGLVGMHDAGVIPEDLQLYSEMAATKDWTVRVYAMVECAERNTFCPQDVKKLKRDDGLLSIQSVKLFADGALGSWGSAMLQPYSDRPDTSGSLLLNTSTLTQLAYQWSQAGFQVNIHAIGDRANRYAIDAMLYALHNLCPSPPPIAGIKDSNTTLKDCQEKHRFRIEHAQIIHPDDQRRMFDVGIIPSIQPTHATSDMAYAEDRLGEWRTNEEAYRMRSFWPLKPVLGSDFPVEPPDPFQGMYAAVARLNPGTGKDQDGAEKGWHLEEALTLEQALEGFTAGAARGAFVEDMAGKIEEGMWADWVVLDEPLEEIGIEGLRNVKVRETWTAGKRVFKREDS